MQCEFILTLKIAGQAQAARCLSRLEPMDDNRTLKHASSADHRSRSSGVTNLRADLRGHARHSHWCSSIQSAHIAQLSSSTSIKAATNRDVKVGHERETYIQPSNNKHLRYIVAQFRTGAQWLNIVTGRHKKVDRSGRICPMYVGRIIKPDEPADCFYAFDSDEDAPEPIEDEHHAIFKSLGMSPPGKCFQIFSPAMSTVSQFLNQPDCNSHLLDLDVAPEHSLV